MAKGRMTKEQREEKQSQGRQLYASGFSLADICSILGVTEKTLRDWRDKYLWEEERELARMKPSRLKRLTLKQALAIENREKLPYSADEISKTVAAFDRIADSQRTAVYFMESMDIHTNYMLEKAGKAKGKEREDILQRIKDFRRDADSTLTKLLRND